ncbi:hypothetical protein CDAR_257551 [Caerostris darwini]|uniref:Uncharacterized protein n=1 Tax=Caerostris darwini TaxID=1538125 RepID=A0AAV4TDI3_9ARAC|nr:hypothetical protein CDAR_257551 [Caerostris darwini]
MRRLFLITCKYPSRKVCSTIQPTYYKDSTLQFSSVYDNEDQMYKYGSTRMYLAPCQPCVMGSVKGDVCDGVFVVPPRRKGRCQCLSDGNGA